MANNFYVPYCQLATYICITLCISTACANTLKLTSLTTSGASTWKTLTSKEMSSVGIALSSTVQLLSSTGPHVPSSLHFLPTNTHNRKLGWRVEQLWVTTLFRLLVGHSKPPEKLSSQSDIALQWSYNGSDISSSSHYQFSPPFLNHDLTITRANDADSGIYTCAFILENEVIDEQSITLRVVPSE